jgi:hypothetical protein
MRLLLPAAIGIGLLAAGGLWLFGLRGHDKPSQTRLLHATVACAEPLGRPPKGSSLVQPKGGQTMELYLPKRCLLDRKSASS